jgi:MFS family permease
VSLGLTVTSAVGAVAGPLIGHALDRYPLKRIIGVGTFSMALGFLALSQVRSPLEFYLALGIFIGFGASAMGGLATAKLVANWFSRKRGMALGIAATGISASGVVMPLITAGLIEAYGWRNGFVLYGCFTALVVLPVVLRLVITSPEKVGLRPDGELPLPKTDAPTVPDGPRTPVLKEINFWVLVVVIGLLFCCQSATLTHMVPRLTDGGISLQAASLVMSVCAGFGILGKLSFGYIGDMWKARNAFWCTVLVQLIGQICMMQEQDLVIVVVGAAFFGYGMGGVVPLQGALVGRVFGRSRFGRALGTMRPAMFPIQIIGVPFAGWMFDVTGSYQTAFTTFLGLYVLAAIVIMGFRERA